MLLPHIEPPLLGTRPTWRLCRCPTYSRLWSDGSDPCSALPKRRQILDSSSELCRVIWQICQGTKAREQTERLFTRFSLEPKEAEMQIIGVDLQARQQSIARLYTGGHCH